MVLETSVASTHVLYNPILSSKKVYLPSIRTPLIWKGWKAKVGQAGSKSSERKVGVEVYTTGLCSSDLFLLDRPESHIRKQASRFDA